MAKTLKGSLHAHGCVRCQVRYQDACTEPGTDAQCARCRGLRVWQLLLDNAAPAPCCQRSRLVSKEEKDRYRLAGTRLWFICPTCARTHPFDPRRTTP